MRRLLLIFALGGCQLLYPLEPGEPPPVADCSQMRLLADSFSDPEVPPWINERSTRLQVASDQLVATLQGNLAVVTTDPFYDLRGGSIDVRVGRADQNPDGTVGLALALLPTPDRVVDEVVMQVRGTMLEIGTARDEVFTLLRTVPYPDDRPIWRIAESGGAITFSIADDDGNRSEIQTLELDVTFVRPRLGGGISVDMPFTVLFDDVNGGVSEGEACRARLLSDQFDGNTLDLQRWGRSFSSNCELLQQDGEVTMRSTGSSWVCSLGSTMAIDLIEQDIRFEVSFDPPLVFPSPPINLGIELSVLTQTTQRGGFQLFGDGTFRSFEDTAIPNTPNPPGPGTSIQEATYDAAAHRFWRLGGTRDDFGDQLLFEVSSDGESYVPFLRTGNLPGLDQVTVTLTANAPNPESTHVIHIGPVLAR